MSIEQWSDLMFPEREGKDVHVYGSVRAINDDGSYEVQLNASSVTTRCAPCCTAMVDDRVLVLIKADGKCVATGRLGGEIGGGGSTVVTYDDVSNYIAGRVFAYAGTDEPIGALLCDGRAVSRTTYWELFDAIGTTYGAGDGSSTFNLPNIESRTIIGESDSYALGSTGGEEKHTLTVDEMPSNFPDQYIAFQGTGFDVDRLRLLYVDQGEAGWLSENYIQNVNTGNDQPFNVMQPYIVMRYFITTGKGDPASGINPADYPVERGVTDGWVWKKWASGEAECWMSVSQTVDITSAYNDYAKFAWVGGFTYPIEFAEVPSINCTPMAGGVPNLSVGSKALDGFSLVVSNPAPLSAHAVEFDIHIKGKWKEPSEAGGTETIAPTIKERFEGIESGLGALTHAVESANVRLLDRFSGARSLTLTFAEDTSFRMPLILMGNGNAQIPVFSIVALQFANGDSTAQTSFKNMTDHGVAAVSINGFNVTITLDFDNWGNLYGFCPGSSFERIWGS